jgi:hypothetical protein
MSALENGRIGACIASLILALLSGCGSSESHNEQVGALLQAIGTLDLRAPIDRRARQIERLRALPLKDPKLVHVRDSCVLAHAGLLAAESEQAGVRRKLDLAGDGGLTQPELVSIAASVRQAGERLRDAQGALPECEAQTRALLEPQR